MDGQVIAMCVCVCYVIVTLIQLVCDRRPLIKRVLGEGGMAQLMMSPK